MGVAVSQIFWRLPQSLCSTSCYDFPILLGNRLKHGEPETQIFECVLICLQLFFAFFGSTIVCEHIYLFNFCSFFWRSFPTCHGHADDHYSDPGSLTGPVWVGSNTSPKWGRVNHEAQDTSVYFWDVHKFHNGYFQKSYISVFDPRPQLYICFCCWGMTGITLPKARVSSFHHSTYDGHVLF